MAKKKKIAVLGAGSFGSAVALRLEEAGSEVLLVDQDSEKVHRFSSGVSQAVVGDCKNRDVLEELGLSAYDAVVVSLGESIEASTLVTFHLRDLKVRRIIAKAISDVHLKLLERVGANEVIFPEAEAASNLAKRLVSTHLIDFFEIAEGYIIAEVSVPKVMEGKTLRELEMRKNYGLQVFLIRQPIPEEVHFLPNPDALLKSLDILVVGGKEEDIDLFSKLKSLK